MNRGHVRVAGVAAFLALAIGGLHADLMADAVGSLMVESEPTGASVYVDGRLVGEAPLTVEPIAAGVHRVRLVRLGYLENSRLVTVKAGHRAALHARLSSPPPNASSQAALKIVVLEGEGAVNIIQQKTAVAPVIEVRDRNDQPVSGAVVRFVIQKGRASFNGARTLTATTDALGRAAATGLTPTGSGALQIGASATFQGQTAAIAIAQTSVMTAAEAATAVGAGTGGASASGGGGLSNLAIAGIVGAGAGIGGAVLASRASNDSNGCRGSALCGGWQVVFAPPGLIVSACGVAIPGLGLSTQVIDVDANGAVQGTWGSSPILRVEGTMTATGLTGTLRCLATPATGTMSAQPSGGDYLGTATLSGTTVSIRVTKLPGQP